MSWNLTKIPRIAHFYWGNKTLPYMRYLTVNTFSKLNPLWEIRVHRPKILSDKFNKTWNTGEHSNVAECVKDYYSEMDKIPNLTYVEWSNDELGGDINEIFKSDFVRWKILSTTGGLWSDFDILYIKPISELYLNSGNCPEEISTVYCYERNNHQFMEHSIGFLMGCRDNKHFASISEKAVESFSEDEYQSVGRNLLREYSRTTGEMIDSNKEDANIDTNVVYPLTWMTIKLLYKPANNKVIMPDRTIGIHWYAGDEVSSRVCSILTDEDLDDFPCMLTWIIKNVT